MSLTVNHKLHRSGLSAKVHLPLEDIADCLLTRSDVLAQKFRSLERLISRVSNNTLVELFRLMFDLIGVPGQLTLMLMKFIPLSLATALASSVFPVPGAPYSNIPER